MLIPKLRFEEFNYEWEFYYIGELIDNKSRTYNQSGNYNFNCIELEHINQQSGTINGYVNSVEQKSNKNVFKKNEVLFGKLRPYLKKYWYTTFDGVCSSEIWVLKSKTPEKLINSFIFDLVQTNYFMQLCTLSTGSKMPRADWNYIMEQGLAIPEIKEQVKISNFLFLLDKKIELQSKKIEALKLYKKGLFKLLLCDINEYVLLKSVCTLKNGYPFKNNLYKENGIYNILTISNVTGNTYVSTNFKNRYLSIPKDLQRHQVLKENDILISMTGNVGRVSLNCGKNNLLNQRVGIIIPKDNINYKYLFYCLNDISFEKSMIEKGQGAAQLNIAKEDIENYSIPMPNKVNQNKIANIISTLDLKINLEYELVIEINKLKKGLLQKLFV